MKLPVIFVCVVLVMGCRSGIDRATSNDDSSSYGVIKNDRIQTYLEQEYPSNSGDLKIIKLNFSDDFVSVEFLVNKEVHHATFSTEQFPSL